MVVLGRWFLMSEGCLRATYPCTRSPQLTPPPRAIREIISRDPLRASATCSCLSVSNPQGTHLPPQWHSEPWLACPPARIPLYTGTSLMRNRTPLGPYSGTMPRTLWWSLGGGALFYERGTPVPPPGPSMASAHLPPPWHFETWLACQLSI